MREDTIKYRYFVAEGEAVDVAIAAGKAGMEAHNQRIRACMDKYGADCLWGGNHSAPSKIGFKIGEDEKPQMKENFLKPEIERCGKGERYAVYAPDKRYKAGKDIRKDLLAVGHFSFSAFVMGQFGVGRECFGTVNGRFVLAHSVCGLHGGTPVLQIPFGGDRDNHRDEAWEKPPFLREIKKSEFIAITEEDAQAAA
jgi:hypothetical protein